MKLRDLKELLNEIKNDDLEVNIIDARETGESWVAHACDYVELDPNEKFVDIGFYK